MVSSAAIPAAAAPTAEPVTPATAAPTAPGQPASGRTETVSRGVWWLIDHEQQRRRGQEVETIAPVDRAVRRS